jgi:hypothetical protein
MLFPLCLLVVVCLSWGSTSALERPKLQLVEYADSPHSYKKTCTVKTGDDGSDDSGNLIAAFQECQSDSRIVFLNATYHIGRALRFDQLHNVKIEINGTLKVSWQQNRIHYSNDCF